LDLQKHAEPLIINNERLRNFRKKNEDRIKDAKQKEKEEFSNFVDENRNKLTLIDNQIKNILSKASLNYEKIDKKSVRLIYFPMKKSKK